MTTFKQFLLESQVALDELFIFQDNTDLDHAQINRMAAEMREQGTKKFEEILVGKLTPSVKKELQRIQKLHDTDKRFARFKGTISDELLKTTKKFVLLDGNHRYLAAKKAGVNKLPYDVTTNVHDMVSIMYDGYF